MHGLTEDFIHYSMYESQNASLLQKYLKMHDWMGRTSGLQLMQCDAMLRNATLMASLRAAGFHAILSDPMMLCTDLLADLLGLPLVISLRFSFGAVLERHCGHAPAPPSFVPAPPLSYGDRMTFTERLVNVVTYTLFSAVTEAFWRLTLDPYYSEIKGSPTSMCETIGKADIWLIRTFWDLDDPRPFLPNFKFVGGLHCKPANQLPEEMEEFVQSSGDAGLVVFSLGSMVTNLTKERADVIAAGLARLPQKVIWKYKGEKPATLAPNTKLYHWIPQNDLLGHPKTKAFITHGGTNGLYEAIYHGVPLVGIPLFADQPDNILRMVNRGAAVSLDFSSMTSEDLEEALKTVIGNLSYKSSIQRLSALQRDQPVAPLDAAVFWIEFVMRHGGARHLRVQSHHLNWFQYHSLDTCAALLAVLCTTIFIFYKSLQFCLQKCFSKRSEQREKTE
ncbi:UDP-glucuronosyltransferase 2A2-like [Centroberyx affinis]|uniref:UDP-glucuronosyltransferase 2A2-like n=1 Tax=Centroberyx affinis TaxID=166261 RepID=UPI003A5BEEBD